MKFKQILKEEWFSEMEQKYWKSNETICPFCGHKLKRKYEGLACMNHSCLLKYKLEIGWILRDDYKRNKNNLHYFKDKYDFDIEAYENKKRWLNIKNEVLLERDRKCEICHPEISLHIHHIIYRVDAPSLTFDKENLIILCKKCHTKIHNNDKRKWLHDSY